MRLRPQSELGWQMLQWLAVLVLGHQAQANPELLRGVARTLTKRKAPAPGGMVITGIDRERSVVTVDASRPNAFFDEVGFMTPELLDALASTGQMVIDTQPPPAPLTAADLVDLYPEPA